MCYEIRRAEACWDPCCEEPGTLTHGAPVFPGSSRLGIEPKTPGWLVQDPTARPPDRGSDPTGNHRGIWSPPMAGPGRHVCTGPGMCTWYLVVAYRGNGVIHRGIYQLQGDDNGHVGRPC